MIQGIGSDLVAIERMAAVFARHGERLAERLLAEHEIAELAKAEDKPRFLAKRFAAKEALAKALGTGVRGPVLFPAMGVIHDALGKPSFSFASALTVWLAERGVARVHLSVSDERDYALAFVVVE